MNENEKKQRRSQMAVQLAAGIHASGQFELVREDLVVDLAIATLETLEKRLKIDP